MQATNKRRALPAVCLAVAFALGIGPASADCPELPPTDDVCINMETTPDCGANCCSFRKDRLRSALVIGNNNYSGKLANLCNAGFDARTFALKLKGEGFNVCCMLNASHADMEKARIAATNYMGELEAMKGADGNPLRSPRETRFVAYFAGHGSYSAATDENGVPAQTSIYGSGKYLNTDDFKDYATRIGDLRDDWGSFKAVHPIIVVDACRTAVPIPSPPPAEIALNLSATNRRALHRRSFSARSFAIPPALLDRSGGYVVIYSTKAGTTASDVVSGAAESGVQSGRFMKFFSGEIDSWGRKLDRIFDVVHVAVKKNSAAATPPDGQEPIKDDHSPLFNAWPWRVGSDDCAKVMNAIGNAAQSDEEGGDRCPDMPYADCLKSGDPSPTQCGTYKNQRDSAASDTACLSKIDQVFGPFFGANGARCHSALGPDIVARNFTRGMTVADARLDQTLTSAAPTAAIRRSRSLEEREAPPPEDTVEVRTETELRSPDADRSAVVGYAQKGTKLELDCAGAETKCSPDWVGVRAAGRRSYVHRSAVRARSAANATVDLTLDKASGIPTKASLEALQVQADKFIDKPDASVHITAEVANSADAAAIAEAERRATQIESLMQASGFTGHKFTRGYVVVAKDVEPSQVHLEFFENK